jgi:hypothetical protein
MWVTRDVLPHEVPNPFGAQNASRLSSFCLAGYLLSSTRYGTVVPTHGLHGMRPCLRGSDSIPSAPQIACLTTAAQPDTLPEPTSPLGVGHTEDSQPGSLRPNRRLLKDWIAWTTLAGGRDVSSTFHRVTPAYGPCPKFFCLGTVYPFPSYHVERQVFETYCKSSDPVSNRAQSPD